MRNVLYPYSDYHCCPVPEASNRAGVPKKLYLLISTVFEIESYTILRRYNQLFVKKIESNIIITRSINTSAAFDLDTSLATLPSRLVATTLCFVLRYKYNKRRSFVESSHIHFYVTVLIDSVFFFRK